MPNVKDKALTLEDLKEALVQTRNALPAISSSDEGKIMRVDSEGNWSAEELPVYSGESGWGSRPITVASGTFTGNGSDTMDVFVGKKMPNGYFHFHVWIADDTEFIKDMNYKVIAVDWAVLRANAFDFSTDGLKTQATNITVIMEDNSDTKTTIPNRADTQVFSFLRANSINQYVSNNSGFNRITKDENGFTINLNMRNGYYYFVSGLTYNFEVIYYGTDPTNEIVEVA